MYKFDLAKNPILLKEADEKGRFTLDEAMEYCRQKGERCRLPTKEELEFIRSEALKKGLMQIQKLNFRFGDSETDSENALLYLCSNENRYDDITAFNFNDGRACNRGKASRHLLRIVVDFTTVTGGQVSGPDYSIPEIITERGIEILKKYVTQIDDNKIRSFLLLSFEYKQSKTIHCRYISMADYNVSTTDLKDELILESLATFSESNEIIQAWEKQYLKSGFYMEDLTKKLRKECYLGILDLHEGKYLKVNGIGDCYEFGVKNKRKERRVDWSKWCK